MSNYHRPRIAGATVFFTVALARRGGTLLVDEIEILREAVLVTRARRPFHIDAWVVLPDHMHAVWTLPLEDANFSDRWGAIKARFSKHVRRKAEGKSGLASGGGLGFQPNEAVRMRAARSQSKRIKQDAGIWQRRFWEHHIRDARDYAAHVRYCWINPVKHGFVERPADWAYSLIHRDIRAGLVEPEFSRTDTTGRFGEP